MMILNHLSPCPAAALRCDIRLPWSMMNIRVEFYGVARLLAERAELDVRVAADSETNLGDLLQAVAAKQPSLTPECIIDGTLGDAFVANLDGEQFVRDPQTLIRAGQSLLILSADAGG